MQVPKFEYNNVKNITVSHRTQHLSFFLHLPLISIYPVTFSSEKFKFKIQYETYFAFAKKSSITKVLLFTTKVRFKGKIRNFKVL